MKVVRMDRLPVKALKTDEGFYYDPAAVLTRSGIFTYTDPKTGKVTKEYRPDSEVFNPDHLAAIGGLPITHLHKGKINSKNAKEFTIGAIVGPARQDGMDMVAPVKVFITDAIDQYGHKELSLGYEIELDETPGEFNGERYDAVQRNLTPNHLAIVPRGRAGTARLNLDAADDADEQPVVKPKELKKMKTVRLDNGIEYEAAPEVIIELDRLRADVKNAVAAKDAQQARADAAEADVKKFKAEVETARSEGQNAARARLTLEGVATAHKVTFKADTADLEIKTGVIKAIRGDAFDAEGRTEAYIDAAYDLAVNEAKTRSDAAANQRQEMHGKKTPQQSGERKDGANDEEPMGAAAMRDKYRNTVQTFGAPKK